MTVVAADRREAGGPAGIPNFAWAEAGRLARGQQPALTEPAYRELRDHGVGAVLSLRPEREYPDGGWRAYDVADERALCDALGLAFHHVPCIDFQAPGPGDVAGALAIVRDEVERGRAVYVHCLMGVGRTGVISGAWQMLRGATGTEALRQYVYHLDELRTRVSRERPPDRAPEEFFPRIGAHYQAWVLVTVAKALGLPVERPAEFVRPRRPGNGRNWRRRFDAELRRHRLEVVRAAGEAG